MKNFLLRFLHYPNLLLWSQIIFLTFSLVLVLNIAWGISITTILSFVAELLTKFFVTHLVEKIIGGAL